MRSELSLILASAFALSALATFGILAASFAFVDEVAGAGRWRRSGSVPILVTLSPVSERAVRSLLAGALREELAYPVLRATH